MRKENGPLNGQRAGGIPFSLPTKERLAKIIGYSIFKK
jgi:hypothetical protein